MKLIVLGSTDISVSRIGLGTVKFGRNEQVKYPTPFELPTDKHLLNLLACAQDLGVNLLDTAPAYGASEERLGHLLKGRRQQWILTTKVGEEFQNGKSFFDFSEQGIINSVERSLKRLKTDYLDIVLVHSNGDDKKIIEENNVFQVLQNLKTRGMVRAFGMSTKTVEGGFLTIDNADVAMVAHNPVHDEERSVIEYAQKKNKSIFIKKALASGHLDKILATDPVMYAMKFIFKEPGVNSVIVGTLNAEHLKHNVDCVEQALS